MGDSRGRKRMKKGDAQGESHSRAVNVRRWVNAWETSQNKRLTHVCGICLPVGTLANIGLRVGGPRKRILKQMPGKSTRT